MDRKYFSYGGRRASDLSGDFYKNLLPFLEIADTTLSAPHRPTRTQEARHTTRPAGEIPNQFLASHLPET